MINLENTLFSLNAHLDDNPTDWDTHLVLADALEEEGRNEEAYFQRWLVKHRKTPELC